MGLSKVLSPASWRVTSISKALRSPAVKPDHKKCLLPLGLDQILPPKVPLQSWLSFLFEDLGCSLFPRDFLQQREGPAQEGK